MVHTLLLVPICRRKARTHRAGRLCRSIAAVLAATHLPAIIAHAQNEPSGYENEPDLEEVIVTGSRIIRDDGFGRISPVTVIGSDVIGSFGYTRIEEMLNTLPQVEAANSSFDSNGATGTASLDLRGLGSHRTLVLVNGRRMQPGGVWSLAPDVNQIPAHMIERVEILTGGASAVYGADAVSGVANFIMRRVDGVEVSAGISGYQHDNRNSYVQGLLDERGYSYPSGDSGLDGRAYNVNAVIGGDFAAGRGHATVYANWRKNDSLLWGDRDYSSCALTQSGMACGGSFVGVVPRFYLAPLTDDGLGPNGFDYRQALFVSLQTDSSLGPLDTVNSYNYAPINYYMRPDERWSMGAFADFEVNEHAVAYLELMAADDRTRAQLAESGLFFNTPYPLSIDNTYFPENFRASLEQIWPGQDDFGIYIGKRNLEGGPRADLLNHLSFRIVAGLKGVLSGEWEYDVSYLRGHTSSSSTQINDFYRPNINIALDSRLCDATPSCIPYEVFTYEGVTREAAERLSATGIVSATTTTDILTAYVTGAVGWGLPAGDIMTAAGYEYRKVGYDRLSDEVMAGGLLAGSGGFKVESLNGQTSVNELFIEANIPILADRSLARRMTMDLAYRYSHYSTSGGSSTWRAGLDWQILDWLRVRGGYNRAVRSPDVAELYSLQQPGSVPIFDPCTGAAPAYSLEMCARSGVTAEQYGNIPDPLDVASWVNTLRGGNPHLEPEKADTLTAGVVIDVGESMQVSLDYWDIRIDGVIDRIGPQITLEQCMLDGQLCDLIHRAPNGSLWQGTGYVSNTLFNLGKQHSLGGDLAWAWSPGLSWKIDLIGTYYKKKETTVIPGDPDSSYDCAGQIDGTFCYPSPKWRHTASVTYDPGRSWSVTGRWRYFSKVSYEGDIDLIADDNLAAQNYLDLNARFRFLDTHELVAGVNNVLDKQPPLVGSTLNYQGNTIPAFYDPLGRYLFTELNFRW